MKKYKNKIVLEKFGDDDDDYIIKKLYRENTEFGYKS